MLDPPWRQHFEGTEDHAQTGPVPDRRFIEVAQTVRQASLLMSVRTLVEGA